MQIAKRKTEAQRDQRREKQHYGKELKHAVYNLRINTHKYKSSFALVVRAAPDFVLCCSLLQDIIKSILSPQKISDYVPY